MSFKNHCGLVVCCMKAGSNNNNNMYAHKKNIYQFCPSNTIRYHIDRYRYTNIVL